MDSFESANEMIKLSKCLIQYNTVFTQLKVQDIKITSGIKYILFLSFVF